MFTGMFVMTTYKSKGKEFEVIIWKDQYSARIV